MITVSFTVREAMNLAVSWAYNNDAELYHKLVNALELALGEDQRQTVTITRGLTPDNRIPCIKALRTIAGYDLLAAKNWVDAVVGGWVYDRRAAPVSRTNSVTLKTPEQAENLLRELAGLGCEGYLS